MGIEIHTLGNSMIICLSSSIASCLLALLELQKNLKATLEIPVCKRMTAFVACATNNLFNFQGEKKFLAFLLDEDDRTAKRHPLVSTLFFSLDCKFIGMSYVWEQDQ